MSRIANIAIGFAIVFAALVPRASGQTATTEKPVPAVVLAVASDQLSLDVWLVPPDSKAADSGCSHGSGVPCSVTHLTVADNLVKDQLKQLHKGDHIHVVYSTETKKSAEPAKTPQPDNPAQPGAAAPPVQPRAGQNRAQQPAQPPQPGQPGQAPPPPSPGPSPGDAKTPADLKTQLILKAWCIDSESPELGLVIVVLLGSTALCFFMIFVFSSWKPKQIIISEDKRYSNSRFQMALWFFVLISTYIAALALRVTALGWDFVGGVNIPQNLLLLSGMSAITFAGAKGITSSKLSAPAAPGQPAPTLLKRESSDGPNFIRDLTHNDGTPDVPAQPEVPAQPATATQPAVPGKPAVPAQSASGPQFDFGDFQMLIVTLIAVATYIVLVCHFFGTVEYSKVVSLPDVDTTLLATFGLGQGAYLTKKAVGNLGTS